MKHLNTDFQPLAKGNFPNRGPWLLGDDFGTKAKSTLGKRKAPFPAAAVLQRSKGTQTRTPRAAATMGASHNHIQLGPSSKGWDCRSTTNLRRSRHPAPATARNEADQGSW